MFRFLLAVSLLAVSSHTVLAEEPAPQPEIRRVSLSVPPPDGYCILDSGHPSDLAMLNEARQFNAGHNSVIAIFTECRKLATLRSYGGTMSEFVVYMSPQSATWLAPDMSRGQLIDWFAAAFEDSESFNTAEAEAALQRQDEVSLGVLDRSDTALFTGTLVRAADDGSGVDVNAVVGGITAVGGMTLTVNLHAPYLGPPTIDRMLAQQRVNLQRLVEAN